MTDEPPFTIRDALALLVLIAMLSTGFYFLSSALGSLSALVW